MLNLRAVALRLTGVTFLEEETGGQALSPQGLNASALTATHKVAGSERTPKLKSSIAVLPLRLEFKTARRVGLRRAVSLYWNGLRGFLDVCCQFKPLSKSRNL